ncbi:hypothetical protein N8Z24_00355 [bacterium]|nr:hypothetical protein [bacterium]
MRTEWKSLGVQLRHIFRLPISRPCQIVLFILADSADDFNPSIRHIGKETEMDSSAVSKILKTLASRHYIKRQGLDSKGRTKWLINIETIAPLVSHLTSCTTDSTSTNSCLTDSRGAVPQTAGVLYHRQHEPLKNPKINLKDIRPEPSVPTDPPSKPKKTKENNKPKKPPRPHSVRLAEMWYDKSPPSEKHNKAKEIEKWARSLDTEQNVTGYTEQQMLDMVRFRCWDQFWRDIGARRPGGLSKKGKDGTRKTVTIYEGFCSSKTVPRIHKPMRQLERDELPF